MTKSTMTLVAMPWTRDQLTLAQFEEWVASRKDAGRKVDIETCEMMRAGFYDCDPYGLFIAKGDLPPEMRQMGTQRYVRSPESCGWINEEDLPFEKVGAMYARLQEGYAKAELIERKRGLRDDGGDA